MPARVKTLQSRYQEGASESEDDLITAADNVDYQAARANIKPTAAVTVKQKAMAASTRSAKPATKRRAATKNSRPALTDRTNLQPANEDGEDGEPEDEVEVPKAKRAKTTAATRKTTATTAAKTAHPSVATNTTQPPRSTIPETQPEYEDISQSIEHTDADLPALQVPSPSRPQRLAQRAPTASLPPTTSRAPARSASAQPTHPYSRERSGSASAVDRRGGAGDAELRRKLTDLTRKHDDLQLRYDRLESIGTDEAETNFAKLQRASEQKTRDANELIAALKREVGELKKAASATSASSAASTSASTAAAAEAAALQKQIAGLTAAQEKTGAERDAARAQLAEARNEVKALEAKLTAARQQISASAQEAKAAAAKSQSRAAALSTAATDVVGKEARMKENLYADLTGLIIRAVKQKEGEDEFDCIQTGRNGTLHFHLAIGNDSSTTNPRTPSGLSYEETEFAYEPLLDENRDRELLDLLPDYLTEEICFPRNHAQRFYTKLVDSMTKRVVVEEDE